MWSSLARIRRWRANPAIGYGIVIAALLIAAGSAWGLARRLGEYR